MAFFRPDATPEERERVMHEFAEALDRLRPTEEQRRRELDEAFAILDRIRPKVEPKPVEPTP